MFRAAFTLGMIVLAAKAIWLGRGWEAVVVVFVVWLLARNYV